MQNNLKIAYFIADLGVGGQEKQLFIYADTLSKKAIQTHIFVWNYSEADHYAILLNSLTNVTIHPLKGTIRKKISTLNNKITSLNLHLVHCFSFYLNFYLWLAALGTKTVAVGAIRSRIQLHLAYTGRLRGYLSLLLPFNKISNNQLCTEGLNFIEKKLTGNIHIITNFMRVADYSIRNIPNSIPFKTVSIGQIYSAKRIDLLIETIYRLRQQGINIIHHHYGIGVLAEEMQKMIHKYELGNAFILKGKSSQLPQELGSYHLFLHSSDIEGYPNVIMEAMAAGLPVISTNCGDVPFIVQNGKNGFIVPTGSIDAFVQHISTLHSDETTLYKMGICSRELAEKLFSTDHLYSKTQLVYQTILNQS
jgi:glycosyltransferase involved in cell wall biosynthesis